MIVRWQHVHGDGTHLERRSKLRFGRLGFSRFLLCEVFQAAMKGDTVVFRVEKDQNLTDDPQVTDFVQAINNDWRQSGYYDDAESADWIGGFWSSTEPFEPMFRALDRRVLVELACGHGRQTAFLLRQTAYPDVGRIYLLDVNEENVEFCRKRFEGSPSVTVYRNNGNDFQPIGDCEATGIFCYDSMVHFEYGTVFSYIKDAMRILISGGRALFHHSNYDKGPGNNYHDNPDWRNFMSKELFAHAAMRSGFKVLEQVVLNWSAGKETDCVTLLEK